MGNTPSKSGSGEEPVKTTLFEKEPSGITYRIPALVYLQHSHTFLAFAEKRTSPSDHDAKILVVRRGTLKDNGSVQWSSSQELSTACLPNHRTMNPCPVYEKNSNTLFLFFICIWGNTTEIRQLITGKNKARLCCVSSSDDGQTWSQTKDLTESVIGETIHKWATFAVGPGHGVQMENGRLIVPAYAYYVPYRCCSFPIPFTVYPRALSIYSEDFGQTWHIGWDRPRIIHSGPSGYSDLAYNGDKDQFSCLIECGKESELEQIAFMSFTLNDVMQTGSKKEKKMR
ncbi:sialidase-3.1 isoform X2 [Trachinotus anak]|uniref:sialidase-3.1 isoform X2 n=1 Tax=Trachinotus anak TaxID=443729 RepID=UPI0039F18696